MQASSLASDTRGNTPVLSRILKNVRNVQGVASHALQQRKAQEKNELHVNDLADQDSAVRYIGQQHRGKRALSGKKSKQRPSFVERAYFSYVVTRPTSFLTDAGPSSKKISASKSVSGCFLLHSKAGASLRFPSSLQQPGPFPISHADLAEFSLNALLAKKLKNSCPYVVADGF